MKNAKKNMMKEYTFRTNLPRSLGAHGAFENQQGRFDRIHGSAILLLWSSSS